MCQSDLQSGGGSGHRLRRLRPRRALCSRVPGRRRRRGRRHVLLPTRSESHAVPVAHSKRWASDTVGTMTTLQSSRLLLRPLSESDLTPTYVAWLNDPAVTAFLETRFSPQTLESVRVYWQQHHADASSPWWAICRRDEQDRHIGNIKLGPIHPIHRRADISLFIGDRTSWGQGLATEAIRLVCDWAFKDLKLLKLCAGLYASNQGSRRAFEKCGFRLEGRLCQEAFDLDGTRTDILRLGLLPSNPLYTEYEHK